MDQAKIQINRSLISAYVAMRAQVSHNSDINWVALSNKLDQELSPKTCRERFNYHYPRNKHAVELLKSHPDFTWNPDDGTIIATKEQWNALKVSAISNFHV